MTETPTEHTLGQLLSTAPAGREMTGRIRPNALPKIGDQTRRFMTDPPYRETASEPLLPAIAAHLATAGLYWVSADMAALSMSAGAALEEIDLRSDVRPSPAGLMLFDGGIGALDVDGRPVPVDAVTWGPVPGGLLLCWLVSRWRVHAGADAAGVEVSSALPPLIPTTTTERSLTHIDTDSPTTAFLAATVAAWHLMQQPTLADTWHENADRKTARTMARTGREDPGVTVVDLRRLYRPTDPDHQPETGRGYFHRWVVTGHWRSQPYGPDRALRKRIYIPDYLKGPDGAPLLVREKVNVWRR